MGCGSSPQKPEVEDPLRRLQTFDSMYFYRIANRLYLIGVVVDFNVKFLLQRHQ